MWLLTVGHLNYSLQDTAWSWERRAYLARSVWGLAQRVVVCDDFDVATRTNPPYVVVLVVLQIVWWKLPKYRCRLACPCIGLFIVELCRRPSAAVGVRASIGMINIIIAVILYFRVLNSVPWYFTMAKKYITVTVSVRVSVTVIVSLVWFVSSNS